MDKKQQKLAIKNNLSTTVQLYSKKFIQITITLKRNKSVKKIMITNTFLGIKHLYILETATIMHKHFNETLCDVLQDLIQLKTSYITMKSNSKTAACIFRATVCLQSAEMRLQIFEKSCCAHHF